MLNLLFSGLILTQAQLIEEGQQEKFVQLITGKNKISLDEACKTKKWDSFVSFTIDQSLGYWAGGGKTTIEELIPFAKGKKIPDKIKIFKGFKFEEKLIPKAFDEFSDPIFLKDIGKKCLMWMLQKLYEWLNGEDVPFIEKIYQKKVAEFEAFRSSEGYQKVKWGMTRAEILQHIPKAQKSEDILLKTDKLAGDDVYKGYIFTNDRLVSVVVLFDKTFVNPNLPVQKFYKLKQLLEKKYGQIKNGGINWQGGTFENKGDDYLGTAISMGEAFLFSEWDLPKTTITLICYEQKNDAALKITYMSKEFKGLYDADQEQSNLNDL